MVVFQVNLKMLVAHLTKNVIATRENFEKRLPFTSMGQATVYFLVLSSKAVGDALVWVDSDLASVWFVAELTVH